MHDHSSSDIIMDIEVLCEIYEGSRSRVYLAKSLNNGVTELIAMKSSLSPRHEQEDMEDAYNEASVLLSLRSSSWFPQFQGVLNTASGPVMLMSLFTGGDLLTHLEAVKRVDVDESRLIIANLILAVESLHEMGFIHRNLKPDNIMFTKSGELKVIDFGLCHRIGYVVDSSSGSVDYMAPEILSEPDVYTKAVDYWAIGVILYEMLFGGPPFSDEKRDRNRTIYRIIHFAKYLWFPEHSNSEIKSAISLIGNLLSSPDKREAAIENIKEHPFFNALEWDRLPACKLPSFNLLDKVRILKNRKHVLSVRSG